MKSVPAAKYQSHYAEQFILFVPVIAADYITAKRYDRYQVRGGKRGFHYGLHITSLGSLYSFFVIM
nr:hypothetical protein [uncultured bacterium]